MNNSLLKNIKTPADIKNLSFEQLDTLSEEIRETLISTVAHNGGHLASNLGVVELTVAMHRCFNSPEDKFVFDVGHQVYTHKLLTGRYDRFSTIRTENGLSGFPRPKESEHDPFCSGHSSTSISSAYGISVSELIKGTDNFAVAVIGDGAFTGGLAYEAINNAGRNKEAKLIIILNDNEMSISKNVGSVSKYLTNIRTTKGYFRLKAGVERALNKIPFIGPTLSTKFYRLKTKLKDTFYNSNMFEDLGFRYMGPVDGHNIRKLCEVMEECKHIGSPVLLHVHTKKGKGYELAEKNPSIFHGISQFDADTGETVSKGANFSDEFGKYLCELAGRDERICAITAAMSLGTGLNEFCNSYSDRFFDVGIAEEHAVVFASGLAKGEMVPFFVVYSTFLQRCYDQLIHDAALQKRKMIIAVDRAGFVGEDGETHQGIFDVAFMNTISNFTIYSPSTYEEMRHAMYHAVYKDSNVVAIRYPRGAECELPADFKPTYDVFDIYGDENADVTIVTYGRIFGNACKARNELKSRGKNVRVVKLNRIKPLDASIVEILKNDKHIFFFEEGIQNGGVGEKLALRLLEAGYKGEYKLTAVDYCFVEHGSVEATIKNNRLDTQSMVDIVGGAFGG
ncbi:MAG: 1-deoxy-D-xylulose-5-phosphate synthase [Clostridia bacterium]|nr:1-deoxy-D-xylulose-5-phosphate synthase [Clostridia bacterium]